MAEDIVDAIEEAVGERMDELDREMQQNAPVTDEESMMTARALDRAKDELQLVLREIDRARQND
jgi:septation ring formation regulator EzrA